MVLRVQVKFSHSLLKCGWLWVGHNLCLLWGYLCLLYLVDFLCLLLSSSTYFKIFYFCQKYHLKDPYKIFKKFHVGLKFEWGLWDQNWSSCERLPFELPLWWTLGNCLCKHAVHHSVTTGACSPPHLTCLGLCSRAAWTLNGPICAMIWYWALIDKFY